MDSYRYWYQDLDNLNNPHLPFKLGQIQPVKVNEYVTVVNMIGQSTPGGETFQIGTRKHYFPPIRYESLTECLFRVAALYQDQNVNIVGPKFGAGLAGGDWKIIEKIINEVGLNITIYEL